MVAMLALLASLAGCSDGGADTGGTGGSGGDGGGPECDSAAPWALPEVSWSPCGANEAVCAVIDVPLDWADPCGSTTPLAIRKIPATDPSARVGAILVNPGGPGIGGKFFAADSRAWLGHAIQERFDLVAWDPRGTGDSGPILCNAPGDLRRDFDNSPDDAAELALLRAQHEAFAAACAANAGPLLARVSTLDTVGDMEGLRRILGDETISFFGNSYGSLLGAVYADRHPDRVRAFVLGAALNPTRGALDFRRGQAQGFEGAVDAFLAECSAEPTCSFHSGGDAAAAFDALMASIDAAPLPTDAPDVLLEPQDAELGVVMGLYGREAWPYLADALAQARAGDGTMLNALADFYSEGESYDAYAAVKCVDYPSPTLAQLDDLDAELESTLPHLGGYFAYEDQPCAHWPVPAVGTYGPTVASGAPPILVFGTTNDPATPYAWAVALAEQLQTGMLVTLDAELHGSVGQGNACIDDIARAYLLDGTLPEPDTVCSTEDTGPSRR